MYTIRAYYLQYCGSYAPHRRRRTMDDGRRTPDDGRWTLDAGPSTPNYKLTGELKIDKSPGPDGIHNRVLYENREQILVHVPLTETLRNSFETGLFSKLD